MNPNSSTTPFWKKPPVIIIIILLLSIATIYIYMNRQIKAVQEQAAAEQEVIISNSKTLIADNNVHFLRLISIPFSWALRTTLFSGNLEQVNQYLNDFIRNKNFELILIVDEKGKIISSTDKKLEGSEFSMSFDTAWLQTDSVMVKSDDDGTLTVVTPIMGFTSRLGTMVSVYKPEMISDDVFRRKNLPVE
jgi:hypothetical protein